MLLGRLEPVIIVKMDNETYSPSRGFLEETKNHESINSREAFLREIHPGRIIAVSVVLSNKSKSPVEGGLEVESSDPEMVKDISGVVTEIYPSFFRMYALYQPRSNVPYDIMRSRYFGIRTVRIPFDRMKHYSPISI